MAEPTPSPALAALLRWEVAGGTWQVASRTGSVATVELCRCDGGEVVDTLVIEDPDGLAYVNAPH